MWPIVMMVKGGDANSVYVRSSPHFHLYAEACQRGSGIFVSMKPAAGQSDNTIS